MPGISANLTPQAFAIWDKVPKKERGALPRGPTMRNQGRSHWISEVIIRFEGWATRYNDLVIETFAKEADLREQLQLMTDSRDKLQEIVLERDS